MGLVIRGGTVPPAGIPQAVVFLPENKSRRVLFFYSKPGTPAAARVAFGPITGHFIQFFGSGISTTILYSDINDLLTQQVYCNNTVVNTVFYTEISFDVDSCDYPMCP